MRVRQSSRWPGEQLPSVSKTLGGSLIPPEVKKRPRDSAHVGASLRGEDGLIISKQEATGREPLHLAHHRGASCIFVATNIISPISGEQSRLRNWMRPSSHRGSAVIKNRVYDIMRKCNYDIMQL